MRPQDREDQLRYAVELHTRALKDAEALRDRDAAADAWLLLRAALNAFTAHLRIGAASERMDPTEERRRA